MAANSVSSPYGEMTLFGPRSETVLAAALFGLIAILLIPVPGSVIDMLLALNLSVTVLLLLITLGSKQPLDFSVFPSLLLILTLFRLTLNIATTRAILLNGEAGHIVSVFGNFVVQQNLLVGLVVFSILVIIQFIVITKGAGRISEVAARFILDAMPGKQMAIDAELSAGAIDEATARKRRDHLMREAEFHGAMDGASKFVRGDAIAGLIITAINLIGGIVMGMSRGMDLVGAVHTYSVLTIGDSLVAQIPAFMIALASGILVTKATSQMSLGQEIGGQFFQNPRPLVISVMIVGGLAFVPGMPKLPFLGLALGLGFLIWQIRRMPATPQSEPATAAPGSATAAATGETAGVESMVEDFLQTDRVGIEIGARLIPLANHEKNTVLVDRVTNLRRELARKNGVWVPAIRIRDNMMLDPEGYRFCINGRETARGQIRMNALMALAAGEPTIPLEGEATQEPAFGLAALWIAENDRARAEMAGYTVVDGVSVLITHLSETLRKHAAELLGREDLKLLVDRVRETSPSLVDELIPNAMTMGALHRVMTLLLEENVPISNLTRILESAANHAPTVKDPLELAERIRIDLGRILIDRFRDEQSRLCAIVLDPRLEQSLRRCLHERTLVLEPARLEKLIVALANSWRKAHVAGKEVALLTDTALRRPLRVAIARSLADLGVVAYQEIPNDVGLMPFALIRLEDVEADAK